MTAHEELTEAEVEVTVAPVSMGLHIAHAPPAGNDAAAPMAVTRPAAHGVRLRLETLGNRGLAIGAYRLRRLGVSGLTGVVLAVIAVSLFLVSNLPQRAAVAALNAQVLRLGSPGRLPVAVVTGAAVLESLPRRGDAANIVSKVLEEARASGVDLERGQYEYLPARDGVAARYRMTFPLHTKYPNLREFMDRTLTALPAVGVEALRIERKKVGDESVEAELKLSAYVRSDE